MDPAVVLTIVAMIVSLAINAIGVAMMLGAKKQELADLKADVERLEKTTVADDLHRSEIERLEGWLSAVDSRSQNTDRELRALQIAHGNPQRRNRTDGN
jgi:hypothetical protein